MDVSAKANASVLAAVALIGVIIVCATVLVALDEVSGELFVGAIVAPLIGAAVTFVAGVKGVQQGSQSSTNPPPGA